MRVMFFGTSEFAVPSLERLAGSQAVIRCVTQPDRPRGRGLRREPSPVKHAALRLGVSLAQPERVSRELFDALEPDVGVVVAYGELIGREALAVPRHGMVGVHPSLLPKYRGAAPIARAMLNGESTTGVTIFRLNERLDAGDMIVQRTVPIEPGEDVVGLGQRLAKVGADALLAALELMAQGQAQFRAQDEARATFAPKLTKADGRIDWTRPARVIERLVRAMVPWPGAVTSWRGRSLKIFVSSVTDVAPDGAAPGTVVAVTADEFGVATGDGILIIRTLQLADRRRMSVNEFLVGHPLKVGDVLGT